jgi:hypothetical protein
MTQSQRGSGRPVVKGNGVLNARSASGGPKSNATSFKKGRKKTGGRKAGTPNKTTWVLREVVQAAAEAAGNELGRNGHVGYMTWVALNYPPSFLRLYADSMPQQLEPEQTSPPEESVVLHSIEEIREQLSQYGVSPDQLGRALLGVPERPGTAGPTSSTDDHCVEDDASDDSTGKG